MKQKLIHLLLSFTFCACATSPTGRKQLMLMPDSQMAAMGAQSFEEIKKQTPIDNNPQINTYVNCVLRPVLKAAGHVDGVDSWEIVVFKKDEANAFALPGGHIGVYSGIMKAAKNPAELAAVVGHEVGHVIARHGNERVSEAFGADLILTATGIMANKKSKNFGLMVAALGGPVVQFGILLPHSRVQESEADIIGLELMAKAGYDPHESLELWKNMTALYGKQSSDFLSDHPANGKRMQNLADHIPSVIGYYEKAKETLPRCTPL